MTLAFHEPEQSLAPVESDRLAALEATIAAGLQTFHEVGSALLEIRDSRLYRESHGTFEDYCRERWGFSRVRAHQLIGAAETVTGLLTVVNTPIPANEGQARALGGVDDDLRPAVMRVADAFSRATGKPITAGMIERVGEVLTEAATTGHVDTGSGESTAFWAGVVAQEYEATQRQSQHIRDHYETHDAQGRTLNETPQAASPQGERPDLGSTPEEYIPPHLRILSADSVEWYTPPEYVEAARAVMGGIDLDPASNDTAQGVIQAAAYHTATTNGLAHDWQGRVWLNPPYGRACADFVEKVVKHYESGDVEQAILLLNSNSNETEWFQPLWNHTLCFTRGRINYYTPDGEKASGSTHGSVFVYLGPNWREFAATFAPFGNVVRKVAP